MRIQVTHILLADQEIGHVVHVFLQRNLDELKHTNFSNALNVHNDVAHI